MPTYKAPLNDYRFILNDVLQIGNYSNLPGFTDVSPDLVDAILDGAAQISEKVLQPLNHSGDQEGCTRHDDGSVTTPKGYKEAYKTFIEGGWGALTSDPAYGGQGLPHTLGICTNEMLSSANMAFCMYPGLSHGAYSAIHTHGSDEQKQTYLPKIVDGSWTGTMNLTEPHCGTDLGLMRTKAEPQSDGTYKIAGTKIFISAGEHDLSENIIHLVLAKIAAPDTPAGIKGVSLFIVPKFLVNADGSLGARNGVTCGSIEHKMGIRSNATCVLNYDGATGFLIGEAHKGMRAMFTMMNEARLGVAVQGLSQSEVAYQNAVIYAKERLQGRSLTGAKAPDKPADPIIVHPDIRRILMTAKAFNEGARMLMMWTALHGDLSHASDDAKAREFGDDIMGLLTPVLKAYFTDKGYANATEAQQVYGGAGFIVETGAEQFVRDARIAMIYEGANGIQALDLVGRKLAVNGGRAVFAWFKLIDDFIAANGADANLKPWLEGLAATRKQLEEGTTWLMNNGLANPDNAGAASMDYLYLFALNALAFAWASMAKAALAKPANDNGGFYANKLLTGRFFLDRMLPDAAAHLAKLKTGAAPLMALDAEAF
jgi:alkylation response protein AidB-like acyl-CoA dehydrogenase